MLTNKNLMDFYSMNIVSGPDAENPWWSVDLESNHQNLCVKITNRDVLQGKNYTKCFLVAIL